MVEDGWQELRPVCIYCHEWFLGTTTGPLVLSTDDLCLFVEKMAIFTLCSLGLLGD